MLKIGITGGIGSGKSTVCKVFQSLGIPIYHADIESKKLTNTNNIIIQGLINQYGNHIYINGQLNKAFLSDIIFNDKNQLDFVNNLIHPQVKSDFIKWANNQNAPYVLQEAAILFESGMNKLIDKSIIVTAPIDIRISRVIKRDSVDVEKVKARISAQMQEEDKIKLSDYIIINDGRAILPQILKIHNLILDLIK